MYVSFQLSFHVESVFIIIYYDLKDTYSRYPNIVHSHTSGGQTMYSLFVAFICQYPRYLRPKNDHLFTLHGSVQRIHFSYIGVSSVGRMQQSIERNKNEKIVHSQCHDISSLHTRRVFCPSSFLHGYPK
jgi:hypothetical protein